MEPVSQHTPLLAGGQVSFTGSTEVDTGLRDCLSFTAGLVASAITANEEALVSWKKTGGPGVDSRPRAFYTIYNWKHGTGSSNAGDTAVTVDWMAIVK